ncbi:DUF3598 family protein [Baaleninema sp.]|uniref:DUF3598 family protein n=1 Tax=Baaleninema sp. TaxID=3101197 RepID=UPI003D039C83
MTQTPKLQDFNLFPQHVGTWDGTWTICDPEGNKLQQFTAVLEQRIEENQWRQTNHQTYADGSTETQEFVGVVLSHGELEITSDNPPFSNYKTLAKELDDRLILFKIWQKETNTLRAIELIHLVADGYRVRTTQSFTPDGTLQSIMTIVETKR